MGVLLLVLLVTTSEQSVCQGDIVLGHALSDACLQRVEISSALAYSDAR